MRNACDNHALQELETALGYYTQALEKARGVELRSGARPPKQRCAVRHGRHIHPRAEKALSEKTWKRAARSCARTFGCAWRVLATDQLT